MLLPNTSKNQITKKKKSYAQTLAFLSNIAREILKIKESFSKLQDKKIEHI